MCITFQLKVSASIVGSVVKEKSEEIKQLAKEFVRTQKAMKENSLEFKKYDLNVKLKKMKKEIEDVSFLITIYY